MPMRRRHAGGPRYLSQLDQYLRSDFSMGPEDEEDHINDVLDGEEEREDLEAEMNCGRGADGMCDQAGSEYCDLECPFND